MLPDLIKPGCKPPMPAPLPQTECSLGLGQRGSTAAYAGKPPADISQRVRPVSQCWYPAGVLYSGHWPFCRAAAAVVCSEQRLFPSKGNLT